MERIPMDFLMWEALLWRWFVMVEMSVKIHATVILINLNVVRPIMKTILIQKASFLLMPMMVAV